MAFVTTLRKSGRIPNTVNHWKSPRSLQMMRPFLKLEEMLDLRVSIALLPRVDSGARILGAHKEIDLRLFYQQLLLEGLVCA
ncbi:hypothetical protein Dimus_007631 [Dionaea muscipula]